MTKRFIYLGFLEDGFIGMVASILLVLSADPDSGIQLVILSIIAGYGGEAVLRSFDFVREQNSDSAEAKPHQQKKSSIKIISPLMTRSGYIPIVYKPACTYEQNSIKYR